MKQVININFQGRVVPIEVSAFDLLKQYTESLSRFFANEEGKEEIINDIESRIGELFQERIKAGATCITDEDVNAIIKSMGRPEEFEEASGESTSNGKSSTAQSSTTQNTGTNESATATHKRLYRNESDKIIGGVCSGLANYFGLDPVVVRIIFVVVAMAFGTGILAYIILWLAVPSSASGVIGASRKKLFRDPDDKIIAGVSSGIGNYFGVSAWVPRVLFLLPFLSFVFHWSNWGFMDFPNFLRISFSPGALIVYIILWLVIPEAASTADRLEMKGEKVDMNSIKNSVMEEMKGVQQRAEKFGKEAKTFAEEKGKVMGAEISGAARRSGRSLGDVIVLLLKGFAYFILGCVGFGLVVGLFALAIFSIGIFPLKDFILTDGWQNVFAWGTLIFFIGIPVIGIITWIIRRLAKMKSNRKALRFIFFGLWVVGLFCLIAMIATVGRDFRASSGIEGNVFEIALVNPSVSKLEITSIAPDEKYYRNKFFRMEAFEGLEEDTAYLKNIEVRIIKSPNDSFRVTMLRAVNGRNKRSADTLANLIHFNGIQKDSVLLLDKGITITKKDKFRNQRVILTVYVPVGKQIRIDRSIGWSHNIHFGGPWNDGDMDIDFDDDEHGWESNKDYVMKADGLYTLDGKPADKWKHEHDNDDEDDNKVEVTPGKVEINGDGSKITIDNGKIKIEGKDMPAAKPDTLKKMIQTDSLQQQKKPSAQVPDDSNDTEALNFHEMQVYGPLTNI